MASDSPEIPTPAVPTPEHGAHEGRARVALSIGGVVVLLASYFTVWSHSYWYPPDPSYGPAIDDRSVPFATIYNPIEGFNLNAALWLVGPPLLSALFAFLTLRGSHEARRLFANFGLMVGFFCLEITIALAFHVVFIWGWVETSRVIDIGGMVGFLASLLIFGAAISLAVALPKESARQ